MIKGITPDYVIKLSCQYVLVLAIPSEYILYIEWNIKKYNLMSNSFKIRRYQRNLIYIAHVASIYQYNGNDVLLGGQEAIYIPPCWEQWNNEMSYCLIDIMKCLIVTNWRCPDKLNVFHTLLNTHLRACAKDIVYSQRRKVTQKQ